MKISCLWRNYKYFPYEKDLAFRETAAIFGVIPEKCSDGLVLNDNEGWREKAERLTYFSKIIGDDNTEVVPTQTLLESTNSSKGNGNKQETRYSAHGIHEYRGKYNPQIVRAIGNIIGLKDNSWIIDPFCGSGTTILEAVHCRWNALGIDLNPLSILITKSKIDSVRIEPAILQNEANLLVSELFTKIGSINYSYKLTNNEVRSIGGNRWENSLHGYSYLKKWFTESVLVQLAVVMATIEEKVSEDARLLFKMIFSDILRGVSLQEPADLRIRRKNNPEDNWPIFEIYSTSLLRKIGQIIKASKYINHASKYHHAMIGNAVIDNKDIKKYLKYSNKKRFDAAITSPPYASALPYVDTQRLSMVLLGLIKPEQILKLEKSLTGSRDLSKKEKSALESEINENKNNLPDPCIEQCREMLSVLDKEKDGFRKQNTPALLYKYFLEMRSSFLNMREVLDDDAYYAVVIGQNKSELGNQQFIIDTPKFLSILAKSVGFNLVEEIPLDTYHRYDLHSNNSIRSESLLLLRRDNK